MSGFWQVYLSARLLQHTEHAIFLSGINIAQGSIATPLWQVGIFSNHCCKFPGKCMKERILKISQYLMKL